LIKNSIPHHEVNLFTNTLNATAINIETDSQPITICSIYRPPKNRDATLPDLQKIFRNRNKCITVGDFNAKHRTWNKGQNQNKTGKLIFDFTQLYGLDLITPPSYTRITQRRREKPSTIDFGITKGIESTTVTVIEELSSDHHPLIFLCNITDFSPPKNSYIKFTNWEKFQNLLHESIEGNPTINSTADIDAAAENLILKIQSTIDQS
ncbi:putative RNA-directed DNA polymerase from transposon X-element, partial [Nephila pilipes]